MIDLARLISRLPIEAADAVTGMARLKSRVLSSYVGKRLGASAGTDGSVLSEPFLEGAFPWLPHLGGWDGLEAGLLDPATVALLRSGPPPYVHQVEAWRYLRAAEPASVIVSSGTGSGKTECFLTPILDRLIGLSNAGDPLVGVRALMLYPLNALISSQEERLSKWFAPFGGKLRYCLYNGETPDDARDERGSPAPWRVGNRRALRASPPPVLVTNVTMLEYMLIRQRDAPILERSQEKLEFVILDEAHSYVGAQAAEIALLLRRVALAFGRRPEELRYVATSATIGNDDGDELRRFLAELSGAPMENVHLVGGRRAPLPSAPIVSPARIDLDRLRGAEPLDAGDVLSASGPLREVRQTLLSGGVLSWSDWTATGSTILGRSASTDDAVDLLTQAASAKDRRQIKALADHGGDHVLPIRLHLFHRTLTGLWACVDADCPGRPPKLERADDWPFGAVFLEPREHCDHCASLVLEWAYCADCGDGALKAQESPEGDAVGPWSDSARDDEFEQTLDRDETFGAEAEEGEEAVASEAPLLHRRYLTAASVPTRRRVRIDRVDGRYIEGLEDDGRTFGASDDTNLCPCCNASARVPNERGVLRSVVAGAPYLMSQITPGLLATLSPDTATDGPPRPYGGRRLITFTDARQGTARHAANVQIASERSFTRGFVYHFAQERTPGDPASLEKVESYLSRFRAMEPDGFALENIANYERQKAALLGTPGPRPWADLVKRFAADDTVVHSLADLWKDRGQGELAESSVLPEFLLYRELMRRPVKANSAETLGLFRFTLPGIDDADIQLPRAVTNLDLSVEDWRDLLRLLVTHFLRANVILDFPRQWLHWIDRRQSHPHVQPRQPGVSLGRYVRAWPHPYGAHPSRTVRLVMQVLGVRPDDKVALDDLNAVLEEAWTVLRRFMTADASGYRFQLGALAISPLEKAFVCPKTRRILDTTFRGFSPYDKDRVHQAATPILMPVLPATWNRAVDGRRLEIGEVDDWLANDERVVDLRERGVWGDQQDRAARLLPWLRAAEHSAQLSGPTLRGYEARFKDGRINVLGCSTTMEMGVDIGGIEAVLNTNAPPAIANYRQRVGRAGRARQPIAVGLTLCKDRPLDRMAMADPRAFLAQDVRAPKVSLESPTIARRHAHAFLLARFLATQSTELHKLTNAVFFGLGSDRSTRSGPTPDEGFLAWVDREALGPDLSGPLAVVLSKTPVRPDADLVETLRESLQRIAIDLAAEWDALAPGEEAAEGERAVANRSRDLQRQRLERNYLLAELAGRGFLPSYGFPTDVVQFVTETSVERRKRVEDDENRFTSRGYPSRQRDMAIFEYAPGRSIVVDGVVRESGGVTLNWQRPASAEAQREIQSLKVMRACKVCGELSSAPSAAAGDRCPNCDSSDLKRLRFLSPSGFAVDSRFQVHDDPSDLGGAPPVDPWVSARGAPWRALPDPEIGQLRTSADGMVFWFNPGPHGHGFGICLHCGRAEAEQSAEGGLVLASHTPLRGSPVADDGHSCTGSAERAPFAVARRLALGHEIRTDVCELQLYECRSRETALTVALAVREAVARRLGIDADEMGFAAPQAPHPSRRDSWSAVVFDRASGGAGFSAEIAQDPVAILEAARNLLNCEMPGRCGDPDAVRACPRCVLASDSQHQAEDTDRRAAHRLLVSVVEHLDLPPAHRLFGESSNYEAAPLVQALDRRLQFDPDARLTIFMSEDPDRWDLDAWPLSPMLARWGSRGRGATIAVDPDALAAADAVTRRRFVRWAASVNAQVIATAPPIVGALATVQAAGITTVWASAEAAAAAVGPSWASVSSAPIVRGVHSTSPADSIPVDMDALLRERVRESILEIGDELDGPVSGFGARFKALLDSRPDLAAIFADPCLELFYSDRYVTSPLVVRLLAEAVRALAGPSTRIAVRAVHREPVRARPNRRVDQDWYDTADRDLVLSHRLAEISPLVNLQTASDLPHKRWFVFRTAKASGSIFLDQGFGAWSTVGDVGFDTNRSLADQIGAMEEPFEVQCEEGTYLAVRLDP